MSTTVGIRLPAPGEDEQAPYTLVGRARAKPGQADALEARLLSLVAPTRAEEGALEYHVHRDRQDPDCFVFYEAWRTVGDLERHLEQPYIRAFLAERMTYLAEDMDISWIEMRSGYGKAC
ncbi:putative quinol monooxygenase [Aestuariispira ectoiniformans]|uniref:putative quinol monooxygenase n=1 Tax=Aestuariispira ectoiniformans TaxID=2775080 RepID=UPI00223ADA8B|nr:putative quinol monooxygenase [Aestuariispira ectoiniformans]